MGLLSPILDVRGNLTLHKIPNRASDKLMLLGKEIIDIKKIYTFEQILLQGFLNSNSLHDIFGLLN
jgi:hypothetical protein